MRADPSSLTPAPASEAAAAQKLEAGQRLALASESEVSEPVHVCVGGLMTLLTIHILGCSLVGLPFLSANMNSELSLSISLSTCGTIRFIMRECLIVES